MSYKNHSTSIARQVWLGLAVFFIIFCSCPVKKFVKLQLYRHNTTENIPPVDFTKELKDGNIISKRHKVQVVIPQAKPAPGSRPVLSVLVMLSAVIAAGILFYFEQKRGQLTFYFQSQLAASPVPLYLRQHRLQV